MEGERERESERERKMRGGRNAPRVMGRVRPV